MDRYYMAIDIGASSGRHILGYLEDSKMVTCEVHRFSNSLVEKNGHLCWDLDLIFEEIKNGIKKCREIGIIPTYVGIDTWAVDFVLLDENDEVLGDTVGYRDKRTSGCDDIAAAIISPSDLYKRTGIQKQIFNSIYQLVAIKTQHPELLDKAVSFMLLPDYFNFLLTGKKLTEYTNSTSTQLVSPITKDWDFDLIKMLGLPVEIFGKIHIPGTVVGPFQAAIAHELGFSSTVVLPPSHDTASAVVSVPSGDAVYISSGTWSLMGIELQHANCSLSAMESNFTNEGGYGYRFRFLKNIMGLWMIQLVKKELDDETSFSELCELAAKESISSLVDCNNSCFLAPVSMIGEIKRFCQDTNQAIPQTVGEIAAVIYNSLAKSYADCIKEIEAISGKEYETIYIVGGGANAEYLNRLTSWSTRKTIIAGLQEATAIGNLTVQMISSGEISSLEQARDLIAKSFELKTYRGGFIDE